MSQDQLSAFFEAINADGRLEEKLKVATDLDAALAIAKEAGFDVTKADCLEHQAKEGLEMSDEDLSGVAGGFLAAAPAAAPCIDWQVQQLFLGPPQ